MSSVGISSLSDEILLCILNYVPVCDLLLNVARVCRKLRVLCQDKTLLTHVCLSEEYTVGLSIYNDIYTTCAERHMGLFRHYYIPLL